jgi:hypothetical protein
MRLLVEAGNERGCRIDHGIYAEEARDGRTAGAAVGYSLRICLTYSRLIDRPSVLGGARRTARARRTRRGL